MCKMHGLLLGSDGNHRQSRLYCKTCRCKYCAEHILRPAWKSNLARLFALFGVLYRTEVHESRWNAVAKRLYRQNARYAKLKYGLHFIVWSTKPIPASVAHSSRAAIQGMRSDINRMPLDSRSISSCRKWSLPKHKSRGNTLVAMLPHADLAAVKARTHGIPVRPTTDNGLFFETAGMEPQKINIWRIAIIHEAHNRKLTSIGVCPNHPSPYKSNSDIDRLSGSQIDSLNADLATEYVT